MKPLSTVVDVINQLLDDRCGIGSLNVFPMMGDKSAAGCTAHDNTLLALYCTNESLFRGEDNRDGVLTFFPYRLRPSALMVTNLS